MMRILLVFLLLFCNLWASQNTDKIKNYLSDAYNEQYKNYGIAIKSISLTFPSNAPIDDYKINSISLDSKYLDKKNGILLLNVSLKQTLLKIPAEYQIDASITIYKATSPIKKFQNIDTSNTTKDRVSLDKITQMPITSLQINQISAKSYIPTNAIITLDKIQAKILIHKNDAFIGVIKDGHINLETTLIAKENGSKNQIINAINPQTKKTIRVKVIDGNKGEVL